jgi:rod shape-determining protein MreD
MLLCQVLMIAVLPAAVRPDLVLVFALAMGLRSHATSGLVWAFAAGFAVDALSGSPLGLYALLRGTAAAATRVFDKALYLRAPLPWAIYVLAWSIADAALLMGLLSLFDDGSGLSWGTLAVRLPGSALLSALFAALLLGVFRRLDPDPAAEGSLGSLAGGPELRGWS